MGDIESPGRPVVGQQCIQSGICDNGVSDPPLIGRKGSMPNFVVKDILVIFPRTPPASGLLILFRILGGATNGCGGAGEL